MKNSRFPEVRFDLGSWQVALRVPEVRLELGSWQVAFLIPFAYKDCFPNIDIFNFGNDFASLSDNASMLLVMKQPLKLYTN